MSEIVSRAAEGTNVVRISDADIAGLEIPTGQPIVYQFGDALNPVERYYLSERT